MSIQHQPWYHRNNAVPMAPWVWASVPLRSDPVEVVSYPWQEDDGKWYVNVRLKVGDPTSLATLLAQLVACFDPSSHEWHRRKRIYYAGNPTDFIFADELKSPRPEQQLH